MISFNFPHFTDVALAVDLAAVDADAVSIYSRSYDIPRLASFF